MTNLKIIIREKNTKQQNKSKVRNIQVSIFLSLSLTFEPPSAVLQNHSDLAMVLVLVVTS